MRKSLANEANAARGRRVYHSHTWGNSFVVSNRPCNRLNTGAATHVLSQRRTMCEWRVGDAALLRPARPRRAEPRLALADGTARWLIHESMARLARVEHKWSRVRHTRVRFHSSVLPSFFLAFFMQILRLHPHFPRRVSIFRRTNDIMWFTVTDQLSPITRTHTHALHVNVKSIGENLSFIVG